MNYPSSAQTSPTRLPADASLIDVHTHGIPPTFPHLGSRYGGDWPELLATSPCAAELRVGGRHFRTIDERCWSVDRRLEDMDAQSVGTQVISPIPVTMSYGLDAVGAAELSRFQNEWLAGVVATHPTRFRALATVPLQNPAASIAILEEAMSWGLSGVQIASNVDGASLDDPALEQFYSACEDLAAVVFIHPWQAMGGQRMASHGLLYSLGLPLETTQAALSLILSGTLDRHPGLAPILAHGGGLTTSSVARADRCWADLPSLTRQSDAPSNYLDRFYYDTLVYDQKSLTGLTGAVDLERLMVGTDYPFPIAEEPAGRVVIESDLEDPSKLLLLSANARRVFGVPTDENEVRP